MNVLPWQCWWFRFSMHLMLATLCLVVADFVSATAAGGNGDGGQRFTIAIFAEREKDAVILKKATEGLASIEANAPMLGEPSGQGPYARITVRPGASSRRVSAAVEVLLEAGISKLIVERKK